MKTLIQTLLFFLLLAQLCFAQWVQTNGPTNERINTLTVMAGNLFAGSSVGVFHSSNNGDVWNEGNNSLTSLMVTSFAFTGMNLFAGVVREGVFLSTNLGASWTFVGIGLPSVYALAISGTNLYAGSSLGVFLSTNNGTSWISVGLTENYICALTTSGENIFAGTCEAGIFLSTNRGSSWTSVNNGLTNTFVDVLAVSGENIFAGTEGGGIFLSTNQGANWTAVNNGLTGFVYALAVSGENLFAGTSDGVFHTTNNGIIWNEVNSGLISNDVTALAVSSEHIFAGTAGVWRRPLSEITSVEEQIDEIPTEFLLSNNYPNPFNPSTKIKYSIPQSSTVIIKVFDVLGNEIETLVNEEKPAGTYEITWFVENFPSGVYFYQVKADSFIETKKMVLMK